MAYPYGMKGAPAVGGGLGGLPRRISSLSLKYNYVVFYGIGQFGDSSGTWERPANAVEMRVTVIGAGGGGNQNASWGAGGGGGGCAGSGVVPAQSVVYVAGGNTVSGGAGNNSTATFGSTSLIGGGGSAGVAGTAGGAGGSASGGVVNFTGGQGGYGNKCAGGGGAAGPNGNGGKGGGNTYGQTFADIAGAFDGGGYGPGGGSGGLAADNNGTTPYFASIGCSPGSSFASYRWTNGSINGPWTTGRSFVGMPWDFSGSTQLALGAAGGGGYAVANSEGPTRGASGAVVIEYWTK